MVLGWFRNRRRQRLLKGGFPAAWHQVLTRSVVHYSWLSSDEQLELQRLVQVFVAEKYWEAFAGLTLTDEIRVTIAGQACLLILELEHELYRNVETIYIYPSSVLPERVDDPYFAEPRVVEAMLPVLGEAHQRGPVVLAWDAVRHAGRHPEGGHNLVVHEFAHKLDMLDGSVDGVPPLNTRAEYERWQEVCRAEYRALEQRVQAGQATVLDAYGLVSPAEFFAVASEAFFDQPMALEEQRPALYAVLQGFYRQDTAARQRRAMFRPGEGVHRAQPNGSGSSRSGSQPPVA